MKKGQMEILGFMVIILLIIAIILFYIKFIPDSSIQLTQETVLDLEVSNMLSTIRLQTICQDTQMNDLIKACIENSFVCDRTDTCDYMIEQVQLITQAYGWKQDSYMFLIDDKLYTDECIGNIQPADSTISGSKVKLHYCYE